jgi:hypothetical protein
MSGTKRPVFRTNILNGQPVVRFNAANQTGLTLDIPIPGAGPFGFYAVMKPSAAGKVVLSIGSSTNGPYGVDCDTSSANLVAVAANAYTAYIQPNPYGGAFHVYNFEIDTSGGSGLYMDGTGIATTTFATASPGSLDEIGCHATAIGTPTYSDGDIGELLLFSPNLTPTGRANVTNYLLNKYFGTPAAYDPTADGNLLGWWKADALLLPQYYLIDTTLSGQGIRLIVPTSGIPGVAVVYCHGLGGSQKSLCAEPTDAAYRYQQSGVKAGYMFAATNAHGYQWSNPTAQADVEALVAYLVANYGVNTIIMHGGSAGGPVSLLKLTQGFPGVTVKGWYSIFPVVNLDAAHNNTGTSLPASINAAFPAYPTDAAGRDPILFPASAYNGFRIRCCQSPADTVAPKAVHGDALVSLVAGHALEATCVATTGDHGDPSNYTQPLADAFVAFLNRCIS